MFSEFSATRPTRPPFTFFATDTETKMRRKKNFIIFSALRREEFVSKKYFEKRREKEEIKERKRQRVNMLINADSFSSRFKENGRVFKIKKERRRKKEKKEKRKIFSDETRSRSKFYYALPSSSLGDPLTNFDFSQLFDLEI